MPEGPRLDAPGGSGPAGGAASVAGDLPTPGRPLPEGLRIAVVHEWLHDRSGSEVLFEALAQAFPDADLYALTRDPDEHFDFGGRPVRTTFLDRPDLRARRSLTLPLMPVAWRRLRPTQPYDVVITSSHAFAKSFPGARDALHLNYCHTPMRYVWMPELDERVPTWTRPMLGPLRALDRHSAGTVDRFAANSRATAQRIERFYGRRATVICPPVDVDYFVEPAEALPDEEPYVFAVSRHIPYKRLDLAIEGALAAGVPIVVGGDGPERPALEAAYGAEPGVRFVGKVDRAELRARYQQAAAVVFPAHEDFGIVPIEAQAAGTPVVALAAGGSFDTVRDGVTGALVPEQTAEAFAAGIRRTLDADGPGVAEACRAHAEGFSAGRFRQRIRDWTAEAVAWSG